ncbi:MAG: HEAT repeat domain-containing protein, partial [Planctomycetota bacterium]
MRRGWIFLLLVAGAGAQEFSEAGLDEAIRELGWGEHAAARRLAAWGPRAVRAVPALIGAWHFPTEELRVVIDEALRAIGPLAVPEVIKALKNQDPLVRERAGKFLEGLARVPPGVPLDAALEDSFLDLLDHEDPRVRSAAARTLASR